MAGLKEIDDLKLSEMARNHFLAGGTIESWNRQVKLMEQETEEGGE